MICNHSLFDEAASGRSKIGPLLTRSVVDPVPRRTHRSRIDVFVQPRLPFLSLTIVWLARAERVLFQPITACWRLADSSRIAACYRPFILRLPGIRHGFLSRRVPNMVCLSAVFSFLFPRGNIPTMVSAPARELSSKDETPHTASPAAPSLVLPLPALITSPPPQFKPEASTLPQNEVSSPDPPDGSGDDDFFAETFYDSGEDRMTSPKFDYDAHFRPLENLELSASPDPDPEAELCYVLDDFGPENIKSWCLPDFVSAEVFAIVKGGEPVDFITEFNEFFWRRRVFRAS